MPRRRAIHAIGVGGTEPVEVFFDGERVGGDDRFLAVLEEGQLRSIAELAGGHYYRATDVDTLERIFADLSRLQSAPLKVREHRARRFYTGVPALASLLLFVGHLTLGGVVLRRPFR